MVKVLLIGDSIAQGLDVFGLPVELRKRGLADEVVSIHESGVSLRRFVRDCFACNQGTFDYVIVALGSNDASATSVFAGDIMKLIIQLGNFKRLIWVGPIQYSFRTDILKQRLPDFIDGSTLVDGLELTPDGLHPAPIAWGTYVQRVADEIQRLLKQSHALLYIGLGVLFGSLILLGVLMSR